GVPDDLIVVDLAAINPELRNLRLRGRVEGRRLVPYYSRGEIDGRNGALPAPVIAWTADPVELFFLQVQGSGQIQLDGGERIRGVVRADFFWGGGKDAGALAGRMRQQGKMWLLWPRGEPLPRAD